MKPATLAALALAWLCAASPVAGQNLLDVWVPNGPVFATAHDPARQRLYIGGQFDRIGAPSGAGAIVHGTTGAVLNPYLRIGPVGAVVRAVVSDGADGWFIGGEFSEVQGVARQNLARIDAAGTLLNWNPGADGPVHCLALSAGGLYVGGAFANLGGSARTRLGALDPATGAPTAWAPTANDTVKFLGVFSGLVYVGGDFTQINATTRNRVAAINTSSVLQSWNPNADGAVRAIYRSGSEVALGGDFLNVGGTSQPRVALVSTSGVVAPSVIAANGPVHAFEADGTRLFIGGAFTTIGGASRTGLAAFNLVTHVIDSGWNANLDGAVRDLFLFGAQLYIVGDFETMGGGRRGGSARVAAATATGGLWDPRTGPLTFCVGATATNAFVGGKFVCVNYENSAAKFHHNLAAYDLNPASGTFGRPLPVPLAANYHSGPGHVVHALSFYDPMLYVGGGFNRVQGVARDNIAGVDVTNWTTGIFQANTDGQVYSIDAQNSDVVFCGTFTTPAFNVAWVHLGGGILGSLPVPMPANTILTVERMTFGPLFYGGAMTSVGGSPVLRRYAEVPYPYTPGGAIGHEAFPPDSIAPLDFFYIEALEVTTNQYVYAGGDFYRYGALQRQNLLRVDTVTGRISPWSPNPDYGVRCMTASYPRLYAGGGFTTMFQQPRVGLASFSIVNGAGVLTSWNPSLRGPAETIAAGPGIVAAGGHFPGANGVFQPYLAVFDDTAPEVVGVEDIPAPRGPALGISPNPVRGEAEIQFTLGPAAQASLEILDVQGRLVREIASGSALTPGPNRVRFDASGLPAGVYLARLRDGASTSSVRWVHVR